MLDAEAGVTAGDGSGGVWGSLLCFLLVTLPSLCQGQTPFDVADEGLVEHLEMLQKQQSVVSTQVAKRV